jgi:hypothetical protein
MINLKMLKAAVASIVLSVSSIANAGLILEVDLTVENTITINATSALSILTTTGTSHDGFFLDDFFGSYTQSLNATLIGSSSLTSAENIDNLSDIAQAMRYGSSDLNIWSYTTLSSSYYSSFVEGNQAFTGKASWTISEEAYDDALNGALSGDVYFAYDDTKVLGTWSTTTNVPEPSSIAILALGILGLASRRFKR